VDFTHVLVGDDLRGLPKAPGVVEFLGPGEKSLLVGRPRNIQRFALSHLGQGPKGKPGQRPPLDLRPVARSLRYRTTLSLFEQRLVYERVMGPLVPRKARRDLKDPFYLHLDPAERFPRIAIRQGPPRGPSCYGPFRSRAQAEDALRDLHRRFPLRPCDYTFEPDPALPLGLSCLFAQTRTCAAPCLCRVTEDAYRTLAREAAGVLGDPALRSGLASIPPFVRAFGEGVGLVVIEAGGRLALFPVRGPSVLVSEPVWVDRPDLLEARLGFEPPPEPPDDAPWLTEWLYARKREGMFVVAPTPGALLEEASSRLREPGGETVIT
jgi:hypothetical protein